MDEVFWVGVLQGPVRDLSCPCWLSFPFILFFFSSPSPGVLPFWLCLWSLSLSLLFIALGFILGEPAGLKIWTQPRSLTKEILLFSCFYLKMLVIKQADFVWKGICWLAVFRNCSKPGPMSQEMWVHATQNTKFILWSVVLLLWSGHPYWWRLSELL